MGCSRQIVITVFLLGLRLTFVIATFFKSLNIWDEQIVRRRIVNVHVLGIKFVRKKSFVTFTEESGFSASLSALPLPITSSKWDLTLTKVT